MLDLLMPARVEIVQPFTRVQSFDDDPRPDGIELLVQAVDAMEDPSLMPGRLDAALYEYIPASADPKGRKLEHWVMELTTPKQQRRYWNSMTQMYEFRLGIDPSRIPPAEKYVVAIVYTSPLGEHLSDECLLTYGAAARGPSP